MSNTSYDPPNVYAPKRVCSCGSPWPMSDEDDEERCLRCGLPTEEPQPESGLLRGFYWRECPVRA